MICYKYSSREEIQVALDQINGYWNLDTSPDSTSYYGEQAIFELNGLYWLRVDEWSSILTDPKEYINPE